MRSVDRAKTSTFGPIQGNDSLVFPFIVAGNATRPCLPGRHRHREAPLRAAHAAWVLPVIEAIRKTGATSLRAIAAELTARKVETVRGGAWSAMQVSNILKRSTE